MEEIESFLTYNEMLIYIVVFDKASYQISARLYSDIQTYVDDQYVENNRDPLYEWMLEDDGTRRLMPADIRDVQLS